MSEDVLSSQMCYTRSCVSTNAACVGSILQISHCRFVNLTAFSSLGCWPTWEQRSKYIYFHHRSEVVRAVVLWAVGFDQNVPGSIFPVALFFLFVFLPPFGIYLQSVQQHLSVMENKIVKVIKHGVILGIFL